MGRWVRSTCERSSYTHELQDLFNMIGNVPPQDQVLKFWNSARSSIQKELWRNKLNPEISSWKKVVVQAEIIEIAENVAERRDRKAGQPNQASGTGMNNLRPKHHLTDGSVRAVTFGSHWKCSDRHRGKPNNNVQGGQQRDSTPSHRDGAPVDKTNSKSGSAPPTCHYHNHRHTHQKRVPLSDKEKAEYRAAGHCFGCGKEGHMSRNCPDNASMKSPGPGPPGKSTFSVELVPLTETESEEQTEILDSLPLGAICFGDSKGLTSTRPWPLNEWRHHYPYWNEKNIPPREHIGDCYVMAADCILTLEPSFPGDNLYSDLDIRPELRFHVH